MICNKCLCNSCINNVNTSEVTEEELKNSNSCFNCDECYWYGMDNDKLTKNMKFKCQDYQITNRKAESNRIRLRVIK